MSEESGERSFEPTPSRLAKAKRDGNIARSAEFGANAAFLCAALGVLVSAPAFGATARAAIERAAHGGGDPVASALLLGCSFVPMIAGACGGACAALVQNGGFRTVEVSAKLSRLSPVEGFKRMFSRDTLNHALRASLACTIAIGFMAASARAAFAPSTMGISPMRFAALAWEGALRVMLAAGAVGLAFALAEYAVARAAWLSKLRMNLQELKRELKEQHGDPNARARRKSFHRSLLRGALSKVKDAAFVVVNPTHVAVALHYRPPEVPVPVVLVRASGDGALRVRAEAEKRAIPVIENIPLARALFSATAVGDAIPHEYYVAVAEIVAALSRAGLLG